jgi:anaerobic magnesium-protoporphyrin IX monomethyl ester cyclase
VTILLVTPVADSFMIIPDLGLGYLAANLRKSGNDVVILDCALKSLDYKGFQDEVANIKPDIIGFKVFSKDVPSVQKQVSIIRNNFKNTKLILGGAHPSGVFEKIFLDFPDIDFAIAGEGEKSFPNLVEAMNSKSSYRNIDGIISRDKDGSIKFNHPAFIEDLDLLGFPSWDLIDPRLYPPAPEGSFAKSFPIAPIIATRGCPYKCTFCAVKNTTGRKIRYHSIKYVVDEIEMLYKDFNIREFHFEDDNLTSKKSFVIGICNEIMKRSMKIFWSCPNGIRLDTLDDEILDMMKKSGCYSVAVGIESASENVRNHMKKKLDTKTIEDKVKLLIKHRIKVHGFFIIGYPHETREDIELSLKFSRRLPLSTVYFNIFNPFPGTEIYDELKDEGKLQNFDWATLAGEVPSVSLSDVSLQDLKRMQKKGMLLFYMRPKTALEFISRLTSITQIKFIIKRIMSVLSGGKNRKK